MEDSLSPNLVSVIIPNYNGEKVIKDCLRSVYELDNPNFEVILIDDGSSDNSVEVIRDCYPQTRIIKNAKNLGFAKSVNIGIENSKGEVLVLLNMDTVVRENWLTELIKVLLSNEEVGVAGSKMLDSDGITIQHAGGTIDKIGISRHIGRGEIDNGQYNEVKEVEYVCGAAMGFRKSLLQKIGCLDERYSPMYYEDTDLAFRVRNGGYKVLYAPRSVIVHNENYSTNGLSSRFYYNYHKNRIRFILKNKMPRYIVTKFLFLEIRWFLCDQTKTFRKELVKAYFVNLLELPYTLLAKGRLN